MNNKINTILNESEVDVYNVVKCALVEGGNTPEEAEAMLSALLKDSATLFHAAQFLGDTAYDETSGMTKEEYIADCFNKFIAYKQHKL